MFAHLLNRIVTYIGIVVIDYYLVFTVRRYIYFKIVIISNLFSDMSVFHLIKFYVIRRSHIIIFSASQSLAAVNITVKS